MAIKLLTVLAVVCAIADGSKILAGRKGIMKQEIEEGGTLTLTCKADPAHIRTYRWVYIRETPQPRVRVLSSGRRLVIGGEPRYSIKAERNGEHVDIVLKLKNIRLPETGLFMCWKQNKKPNPQVYVRVLEKDFVEAIATSAEISGPTYISFGKPAKIDCVIRPTFTGKVIWTKDGVNIPESDQGYKQETSISETGEVLASLEIAIARENANYTCSTNSKLPTRATFFLIVKVAKVESLTVDPQKEDVQYSDTITFTCTVSGSDEEILWMRDRSFIPSNETDNNIIAQSEYLENGIKMSVLTVRHFDVDDNGQYVCYVPGDSKYIHINIEGRPPRMIGEVSWEYSPGSLLQFSCSVQYTKGQKLVSWLFEGDPLSKDWHYRELLHDDHKNITIFRLDLSVSAGTLGQYIGTYTCSTPFTNSSTSIYELVPLIIGDSPPNRVEVTEGEPLSIHCSIFGYIAPMVYWEKFMDNNWKMVEETKAEGSPETLDIEIITKFFQFENNTMGEHQELLVGKASPIHSGQYQCKGTNERDTVVLSTQLDVIALLPSVIGMTADEVTEGDDMIITCTVENWEQPVRFNRGITIVSPEDNPRYSIELDNNHEVAMHEISNSSHHNTFKLTISKATIDDQGFYECTAGISSDSIIAIVNPNPPEIIELTFSPPVERSDLFISCTVTNLPSDQQVIFTRDDRNLNESPDGRYSVHVAEVVGERTINQKIIANQATHVLKINHLSLPDSGAYHCMVEDAALATVFIEVEEVDDGKDIFLEIIRSENQMDLVINCTVTTWNGEVSFFHNETLLLEEDGRFQLTKHNFGNGTSHLLQIAGWSDADAGWYQCFTTPFTFKDINITSEEIANMFPISPVANALDFKQLIELPSESSSPKLSLQCLAPGEPQETLFTHNGIVFAQSRPITGDFVHSRATLTHLDAHDGYPSGLQLTINAIDAEDLGYWHCTTHYADSMVLNASLTVELYVPAKFSEVPAREIKVVPGAAVELICIASGLPLVQVGWFKEDFPEAIQSGQEHAALKIDSFSPLNEGVYTCRATNEYEVLEYETILSMDASLRIIDMPPPEVVVKSGEDVDLTCIASGSISPTIDWFRGTDDQIPLITGQDFVTLTIKNVTSVDVGLYRCRASILGAVVNKMTRLVLLTEYEISSTTVNAPTLLMGRLVHLSGPYEVTVGGNFTVTCLVSPLLDLYVAVISFDDMVINVGEEMLSNDHRMSIVTGYGGMGERLYKLTVHSARESDSGSYECQINTKPQTRHTHYLNVVSEGQFISQDIVSTVQLFSTTPEPTQEAFTFASIITDSSNRSSVMSTPMAIDTILATTIGKFYNDSNVSDEDVIPVIIEEISPVFASRGSNIKIPCTTTSSKMPIIWFEERRQRLLFVDDLDVGQDPRFKLEESLKKEINGKTKTLVIENLKTEDAGNYTCSIPHNGTTTASIELIIVGLSDFFPESDVNVTEDDLMSSNETETSTEESYKIEGTKNLLNTTVSGEEAKNTDLAETEAVIPKRESKIQIEFNDTAEENNMEDILEKVYAVINKTSNRSQIGETLINKEQIGSPEYQEIDDSYNEILSFGNDIDTDYEYNYKGIEDSIPDEVENLSESREENETADMEDQNTKSDEVEYDEDNDDTENGKGSIDIFQKGDIESVVHSETKDNIEINEDSETEEDSEVDEDSQTEDDTEEADKSDEFVRHTDIDNSLGDNVTFHQDTTPISIQNEIISYYDTNLAEDDVEKYYSTTAEYLTEELSPFTEYTVGNFTYGTNRSTENITSFYRNTTPLQTNNTLDMSMTSTESPFTDKSSSEEDITTHGIINDSTVSSTTAEVSTKSPETYSYNISDDREQATVMYPEIQLTTAATGEYDVDWDYVDTIIENPVFTAIPGEDVVVSEETEVLMKCPTESVIEDITWKSADKLLYLGSLDLAGVDGIEMTPTGQLRLLPGYSEIKNSVTYTCLVFDYDNHKDKLVMSYYISLENEEGTAPVSVPFFGTDWFSAVVAPSSKYAGQFLSELLQENGLVTRPMDIVNCSLPNYVEGWKNAQNILTECRIELEKIAPNENIFIVLDMLVEMPYSGKYTTSMNYVHNYAQNMTAQIYGALTPVNLNRNLIDIQCGTAVYDNVTQDRDVKDLCKDRIQTSISILWDTYTAKMHPLT